ncbi:uncharacterized protein FA14DRAFT_156322 [Meira miltonrushii]|uniref:Uncharacterized protein n=1 Tax=Meira miltonrushii TaxID=1280837 RepID=A0A316V8S7_9BASI|nr:uncharacterized protein FA14DRAFT_156322 [Meira miltonrushii]PWN33634.1 hypothetical protein FA14DRAFT_156322 [Meira miltonrushii]
MVPPHALLIALLLLRMISSATDSSASTSDQRAANEQSHDHTEGKLSWGSKRARTARFEVNAPEQMLSLSSALKSETSENRSKCVYCRPNCPHWESMSKKQRESARIRLYYSNQSKEEKMKRNAYLRQRYTNLPEEVKAQNKQLYISRRRERIAIMSPKERKAWYKKNRGEKKQ